MNRAILVPAFFFAALLFLLAQLYAILSPFLKPITWSILLALVFQPLFTRSLRLTRGRRASAALLVMLAIVAVVAVPIVALSGVLAREGAELVDALSRQTDPHLLSAWAARFGDSFLGRLVESYAPQVKDLQIDLADLARSALTAAGNALVGYLAELARNLASFGLNLFVALFTVFFLFRDGPRMYDALRSLIPMESGHRDAVIGRLRDMLEAVVRGMVITAALQGLLTGLGLYIAAVPYAAFLAVVAAVLSLLPFGTVVVWLGSAIYLFASGAMGRGIFLVLWGSLVVSSIDNFVRPIVIGGQARLSTLLLFFGMIGGLQAYGFLGLFVGPAIMATLAAFLEIYREEYSVAEP